MNQKNYEFLKDQVKFTGFGDSLEKELKEKMEQQRAEFQIKHNRAFGNDGSVATLHFKKSDQTDMYFFNRYDLTLKKKDAAEIMQQTFYIGKDNNFTLKEAYNLMSGRSVNKDMINKEGQAYNAWVQLDFNDTDANGNCKLRHYHENYGFNLDKTLSKHPIKELGNEQDKAKLMESLQKGNRQYVTFLEEGNEQKRFIEANPRFKSVNVYDGFMNRVFQSQKETEGQSIKKETKKETRKQKSEPDDSEAQPARKKSRKKKQGIS